VGRGGRDDGEAAQEDGHVDHRGGEVIRHCFHVIMLVLNKSISFTAIFFMLICYCSSAAIKNATGQTHDRADGDLTPSDSSF
jgi:hypothetical protein